MNINDFVNSQNNSLFGSNEKKEFFETGIKKIEKKHIDFFDKQIGKDKSLGSNFIFDIETGLPRIQFNKYTKLTEDIKQEVLSLFNSTFDN